MKTLFQICVEGNTGSTGRMAESLGKLAIAQGWKSYIAHGRFPRPSSSEIIRIGSWFDTMLHGLQTRLFDRHCLGSTYATKKLVATIKRINPDIIHLHHLHGYYINMKVLFEYLSVVRIPVVWTFHDCWALTGHCTHFDFIGCEKWKTGCYDCPQKSEYPASLLLDRSKENYRFKKKLFTSLSNLIIVSVSEWLNGIVRDSFLGQCNRTVIYHGVDNNLFKPIEQSDKVKKQWNIGHGFMILGVAGPWSLKKGFYDFIKLSERVDRDTIIVMVGLTRQEIKNLPSKIVGIPRIENQQQLSELYAIADVFLNLSVEETFGLTTAEALSSGTPAIVYNATACPEIIDVNTGLVVEKNNMEELLRAVETIKENGKAKYAASCRERALRFFDRKERYSEYIKLYDNILIKNFSEIQT